MLREILVPLDGSRLAEQALPVAIGLVKASGAHLTLVRVAWAADLPRLDVAEAQLESINHAEEYLRGIRSRLVEMGVVAQAAIPYDHPSDGILTEIDIRATDLVVMSTHGRSGLGRWVYGSVTESVLARSPVPVLVVRANGPEVLLASASSHPRLLVPLDGSSLAETALAPAIDIARATDATIVLLRVVPEADPRTDVSFFTPPVDSTDVEHERVNARRYLQTIANRVRSEGIRVREVVRSGAPADTIREEARASAVSMVAMATHGRTGLIRLVFGSVVADVLHRDELPLLVVRPSASAASRTEAAAIAAR